MFAASKTASSSGYQISRSLRFNSADTTYLNRTPASAGNRQIWTWSAWVKRSGVGADQAIFFAGTSGNNNTIRFNTDETMYVFRYDGSITWGLSTTQVFRDFSAWYHIVVAYDSTQATSTNRVKLYVNGTQVTAFTSSTYPSLNLNSDVNNTVDHRIGNNSGSNYFNGYETETYLIDGQALTPSSFGETNTQTGVWQPKAYSGSYGTNGFKLNFENNSNTTAATLGADSSGNGNNWTPNNFSVTAGAGNDSLVDSPTSYGGDSGAGGEVRGNYCTWNPLSVYGSSSVNGNLDTTVTGSGFGGNPVALGSIGVSSGKWYWEITPITGAGFMIGISDNAGPYNARSYGSAYGWGYYFSNGNKYNNGTNSAYGATYTQNDVIGVALDMDAGTLTFYKNGTSQGVAYSGLNTGRTVTAMVSDGSGSVNQIYYANFGQRPFAYTAPSGFKALCTQNLPTPTIGATTATQAGKFFNPVLYTGNGTGQSITGVGFQPDWVWIKGRSGSTDHAWYDAVRGVQKQIESNNTGAETTESTGLTAFGSDGFTTGLLLQLNTISATYVAWNWIASGSTVSNTAGVITSTVSANTTSGFSVLTYSGGNLTSATIGHGLGVAPSMVIVKRRNAVDDWRTYHVSVGATKYMDLNTTAAAATATVVWNDTAPTSTVFTVGNSASVNASGGTYVAYCFAEVAGYSKFGSYTGNGSTDGPFVFTGFRPAFVLVKNSSTTGKWVLMDTSRGLYNVMSGTNALYPNLSDAEGTDSANREMDFLSNGFKLRCTGGDANGSGNTIIYMAFASSPFKFSLAR